MLQTFLAIGRRQRQRPGGPPARPAAGREDDSDDLEGNEDIEVEDNGSVNDGEEDICEIVEESIALAAAEGSYV